MPEAEATLLTERWYQERVGWSCNFLRCESSIWHVYNVRGVFNTCMEIPGRHLAGRGGCPRADVQSWLEIPIWKSLAFRWHSSLRDRVASPSCELRCMGRAVSSPR